MKQLIVFLGCIGIGVILSGCSVNLVEGESIQIETVDADDRFYQGVFTGCVQTLVMQNRLRDNTLSDPNLPAEIARQCMVVAAFAIQNDAHTLKIPDWPDLKSMRKMIEEGGMRRKATSTSL